jgi:mRNA interferase MazF
MSRVAREVRPGEVWQVSFDPVVGHQQGGTRPALIVSGDQFNALPHGLCVVAPITSRVRDIPTQVPVKPPEGGLGAASVVMCDQLRTISLVRLQYRRGEIEPSTMAAVRGVIARVFAI